MAFCWEASSFENASASCMPSGDVAPEGSVKFATRMLQSPGLQSDFPAPWEDAVCERAYFDFRQGDRGSLLSMGNAAPLGGRKTEGAMRSENESGFAING